MAVRERQTRCLNIYPISTKGMLEEHRGHPCTCSESKDHLGDHACNGVTGCGFTWKRVASDAR